MAHMGQATEQWRHFNERPISELHGEVDSIQTSLKLLFILQQYWNVVSVFQLKADSSRVWFSVRSHTQMLTNSLNLNVNRFIFSNKEIFPLRMHLSPICQILLQRNIWLNSLYVIKCCNPYRTWIYRKQVHPKLNEETIPLKCKKTAK